MAVEAAAEKAVVRPAPRILVIDDEASIRQSLKGILSDEGYETLLAEDGTSALNILSHTKPSAVVLDIWMPGMDGIEVLIKIKQIYPDLPVIMISGHATIATAIRATRMGAFDFVEKPLDMNGTLLTVKRALGILSSGSSSDSLDISATEGGELQVGRIWDPSELNTVAFKSGAWRGRSIPQKTLKGTALLYGQGLHSGKKSGLILEPLPPNSGIHFVGVSETTVVPAYVDFVESTGFATTIRFGETQAGTIEHLMSALHAYGISNLLIKCNGEVPVMDGSAKDFCALFDEIGVSEQAGDWCEIEVLEPIHIEKGREFIILEPHDTFSIDYTLDYAAPVGRQQRSFMLEDIEAYRSEIAPSRTFGFVKDVGMLQSQGLALGGRFDNFVLFGAEGAINTQLRFNDEPVRHKILDAIGDLYLLGRKIRGKVTAKMTGHSDNITLLKALQIKMSQTV
ncbi:MAG: UDP-3-O-[3-hydroxymyristoyl] N-acetylglucosamine deacetylase [Proteobacteria bacterium]|nr:MAG: UDP-3-O-[3-hydroxymyristoyl] N-acetylglucosamine deacetylase [Pseudomonadota bacterium]